MKLIDKITNVQALQTIGPLLKQWKLIEVEKEVNKLSGKDFIAGRLILGEIHTQLFRGEKTLNLVENILIDYPEMQDTFLEGMARFVKMFALVWLNRTETVMYELKKCEEFLEKVQKQEPEEAKLIICNVSFIKGFFAIQNGNVDKAIQILHQSIDQAKELGGRSHIVVRQYWLIEAYLQKGDLDSAQRIALESLKLSETDSKGKLLPENIILKSGPLYDLAMIDFKKGLLDPAIEKFNQLLELKNYPFSPQLWTAALEWLGRIYIRKGDLLKGSEYFEECERHREDIREGGLGQLSKILFDLVHLQIDLNDIEKANVFLNKLEVLNVTYDHPVTKTRFQLAKAFVLKQEKRLHQRMSAYEIFKNVIEDKIEDYDLTVFAILNLCELLIFEANTTKQQEPLRELEDYYQKLIELGYRYQNYELIVQVFLLQSKASFIEKNIEKSKIYLDQAKRMVRDKNLIYMKDKVESYKNSQYDDLLDPIEVQKVISSTLETNSINNPIYKQTEIKPKKYMLVYQEQKNNKTEISKDTCRIGLAQIGLSTNHDFLGENYEEFVPGLFTLKFDKINTIIDKILKIVDEAHSENINVLLFPELSIDLNYKQIYEPLLSKAKEYNMFILPGSFHDRNDHKNKTRIIGPSGIIFEQEKHIPANITYQGQRFLEGIKGNPYPRSTIVCDTEYGRMAVLICRDFLDMDLRVELKNSEPPVDLLFNLAFTPVTADFKAAHFDARRSIYAYCFFVNIAEFGDSFIYTPEKERTELIIPAGKEGIIYKDVNLFNLRSERTKWELNKRKSEQFIQSTR